MGSKPARGPATPAPVRVPSRPRRPRSSARIAAIGLLGTGLYTTGLVAGAYAQQAPVTPTAPDVSPTPSPPRTPPPTPEPTPTPLLPAEPTATPTPEPT